PPDGVRRRRKPDGRDQPRARPPLRREAVGPARASRRGTAGTRGGAGAAGAGPPPRPGGPRPPPPPGAPRPPTPAPPPPRPPPLPVLGGALEALAGFAFGGDAPALLATARRNVEWLGRSVAAMTDLVRLAQPRPRRHGALCLAHVVRRVAADVAPFCARRCLAL